jgi:hypothetical protein
VLIPYFFQEFEVFLSPLMSFSSILRALMSVFSFKFLLCHYVCVSMCVCILCILSGKEG